MTNIGETPLVSIVDDDAPFATSVRRLIASVALKAEAYFSAQSYLNSGRIDETACLVLDIRMPEIDGLELQRRLKGMNRERPIVFLTAHAGPHERRQAMAGGAVRILSKPVRASDLLSAVEEAIARAHPALASHRAASVPISANHAVCEPAGLTARQ